MPIPLSSLKPEDIVRLRCYDCEYKAQVREIKYDWLHASWYEPLCPNAYKVSGRLFLEPEILEILS